MITPFVGCKRYILMPSRGTAWDAGGLIMHEESVGCNGGRSGVVGGREFHASFVGAEKVGVQYEDFLGGHQS